MRILNFSRGAFGICAVAAMLTACGGSQPPIGIPPGTTRQSLAIGTHASRGSWMLPEAQGGNLVYATTDGGNDVHVYSYPGLSLVGTLSGFQTAEGLCTDEHGDVFVADVRAQNIVEYAHGGSIPIATLSDAGNYPNGCAVDHRTGNLAVAGGLLGNANVAIYPHASAPPTIYTAQFSSLFWCTYDPEGNLFIDPWGAGGGTIVELPAGSGTLLNISVDRQMNPGGAIQWDGKHVVIGNPSEKYWGPSTLYQLSISGSTATVINTITLSGPEGLRDRNPAIGNEFWVQGNKVLDSTGPAIGTWSYPVGGEPVRFRHAYSGMGLTISLAPR